MTFTSQLEHSGKLHVHVGARVLPIPATAIYHTPSRSHRGPLTAAVASSDANWLYTSSKDGSIIKWDLRQLPSASTSTARASADPAARARITKAAFLTKRILEKPAKGEEKGKGKETAEGHTDQVLTLALSDDGKVLASGGADKVVGAWDVQGEGASWLRGLGGHKDKVAVSDETAADLFLLVHQANDVVCVCVCLVHRFPARHPAAVLVLVRPHDQAV